MKRSYARDMQEIRAGVWHWQAPHPQWERGEPWGPEVSSYAVDDGKRLLLFDPLRVPRELEELATDRDTAVVLTAPWHERDARGLVERLGVPVHTPPPDTAEDIERAFAITVPEAWVSADVRWLIEEEPGFAHWYVAGDKLPVGVEAFPGQKHNDVVLWVAGHRTGVAGDTIADLGEGPQINPRWLSDDLTRTMVANRLRPRLDLPVEILLATHGGPFDRSALEQALA